MSHWKARGELIPHEVNKFPIPDRQFETQALLALEDIAICGQKPRNIRAHGAIDRLKVVVPNIGRAPTTSIRIRTIQPDSTALALVCKEAMLAIRVPPVSPFPTDVEVV